MGALTRHLASRWGKGGITPADVAALVAFVISREGEWINGRESNVDGGTVLR
jgi:NAD(P)-dependent dehydrogenase (short-subunit alcohol dehydrogenase family)